MQFVEKIIEVDRPVRAVYDQWIRFQEFPQFMEGVKEVRKIDDRHLHWKAKIGGLVKGWDAEIIEQVRDQRVRWRSTSGAENSGAITFVSINPARTRVIAYIAYEPKGILEILGDNLGMVSAMVSGDLKRFKALIESRDITVPSRPFAGAAAPAARSQGAPSLRGN